MKIYKIKKLNVFIINFYSVLLISRKYKNSYQSDQSKSKSKCLEPSEMLHKYDEAKITKQNWTGEEEEDKEQREEELEQ